MARLTGLEPATPGVTGRYSNQLSYNRAMPCGIGQVHQTVNRTVQRELAYAAKSASLSKTCCASLPARRGGVTLEAERLSARVTRYKIKPEATGEAVAMLDVVRP